AAMHLQLDMPVAVKFMDPSAADADGRLRFEREARAIAQLRSPHVVQVLDHGVDNGTPYIVMELLEGEDLEARLRRTKKLAIPIATRVFTQSAKALRRAHDAGIVHRDLKPNNVFLARVDDEEVVKLLDFGVAKLQWNGALDPHNESTQQGLLLGSPCYMSPEQARGNKNIDHRSDLWSLAVILFRSLTGVRPFDANTIADLIIKICAESPPHASSLMPDAPPGLDEFFFRCFSRDPDLRYQSALEMASDFENIVRSYHQSGDHFATSGRSPMTRTASNPGMQAIGAAPQRTMTNPAMPAVVITPQRALTNPQMQAVPAHIMPPGFEPRTSQPGMPPSYEPGPTPSPSSAGAGGYPSIQSSPAAASYVPVQPRVSYPDGMLSSPQPPAFGSGTYPNAAPAPHQMPPPHEAYSSPGGDDANAGAYGAYGAQPESAYGEGSLDFNGEEPQDAQGEAAPAPPPSAFPDSAPHEGLGTTSQTVREKGPSNRQLVVWTSVAAAITAILVVLIVVVARNRYGGQAARPQGTGEIGVVAPTNANPPQQPPQPPQQPQPPPASDTAVPVEPNPANNPGGSGVHQPGAPSASASASAAAAPDEAVPFNVDSDAGPSPPPHQGQPYNPPRPGGAPAPTGKKKPNFGY
ncbi:MAG TPA: protein kinase, partial [Polyangiaceae bacterium]|nr:protein kinase [Polyangiaceae bacterium]